MTNNEVYPALRYFKDLLEKTAGGADPAPVLAPAVLQIGVDPLHFALVMLVNLNIGMITPPYGMTLLTSARIANCSYDGTIRAVIPFLVAELVSLAIITYFPWFIPVLPPSLGLIS
jgi:TRAP-type C4-dicarboxylate transport system permease large subunit